MGERGRPALARPGGSVGALEQLVGVVGQAAVLTEPARGHGLRVVQAGEVDDDPVQPGEHRELAGVVQAALQGTVRVGPAVEQPVDGRGPVGGQDPPPGDGHVHGTAEPQLAQPAHLPGDGVDQGGRVPAQPGVGLLGRDGGTAPLALTGHPAR